MFMKNITFLRQKKFQNVKQSSFVLKSASYLFLNVIFSRQRVMIAKDN